MALLDTSRQLGVSEGIVANDVAASVGVRHVSYTVAGRGGAKVVDGNLSLALGARGRSLRSVVLTRSLHGAGTWACEDVVDDVNGVNGKGEDVSAVAV